MPAGPHVPAALLGPRPSQHRGAPEGRGPEAGAPRALPGPLRPGEAPHAAQVPRAAAAAA